MNPKLPLIVIDDSLLQNNNMKTTDESEPVDNATEEGDEPTNDSGIDISEEFQKEASTLLDGASPEELHWVASKASKMCYDAENPKDEEMSTDGMPTD